MVSPELLAKAERSYQLNRKHWEFLGYNEAIALAVLVEFFSMEKLRNPSQKPLNVLAMVGKNRVREIAEEVKERLAAATEGEPEEASEPERESDPPDEAG